MQSLWAATAESPEHPVLHGDETADVLVIGGGMAGVLCARMLTDAGVDCALLEGDRVGCGVTANTTAKISSQHGLIYSELIRLYGVERAQQYYEANQRAVTAYRDRAQHIACGMRDLPSFVYSLRDRDALEQEVAAAQRLHAPASLAETLPLPLAVLGAVRFEDQAQFHPLQFLYGITDGLRIYEHSFAHTLRGTTAYTERGSMRAKAVVIATHFPILNRIGCYFMKMYQHRSYIVALDNAPDVGGMYVDEASNGLSFRNHEGYLLLGGGDHRTGQRGEGWEAPRAFARAHYPDAPERYHWATQDCMTLDGAPYIGRYARSSHNLYVATGFNKWGMTGSMVAATLLTDMLTGRINDCAEVFSPSRSILHKQLFINAFESTIHLLSPQLKRCTHQGCALQWNPLEHTWDCPCHGSRFDEHGSVLNNPAMKNLK